MSKYSSSNSTIDKYFLFFMMLMFMYGRMASTLAMCVVWTLLWSDCFYLYYVGFGNVRGLNPSMVRLLLSFIKYVHARQRDKARQRAEIDRSVKETIANDNATKRQALSMSFFLSNPICSLVISITMLGSTRCCYVNGSGNGRRSRSNKLLLLLLCREHKKEAIP